DPQAMWAAVVAATRALLGATQPVPPIAAIAVTSQYMSTVPVAADGTPTGPCILWMDNRGAAHSRSLLNRDTYALFVERHGMMPLPSGHDNVAHAHVLQTRHPSTYEAAAALVEPMDYLTARLTGHVTATQSTVFGQLVCDNRTWGVTSFDDELVAATRLDPSKLAPLVPMNSVVGEVLASVAEELGIAAGIPVIAGTIDSITSAVGTGALGPADGSVIIGTTSVMVSHIAAHRGDIHAGLLAVPSPLPGMYYVMAENGVGGRAFEWARHLFGYGDDVEAALADAAAVEADGVQFLPWLIGSNAPQPNDDVRAAYVGLGLAHDRRHVMRATLEGIALNLGWLLPHVEGFVGNEFRFLRFGGGGAQSPLWAQLLADATGRPVHRLAEPRATNARGAAFLAFAALGLLDLADVPSLLQTAQVHEPDASSRDSVVAALARLTALHPALSSR
ncbi:MAG: FGGY-family carbohydrate kinase, partial [Ilumatobacteraceae bacterium]